MTLCYSPVSFIFDYLIVIGVRIERGSQPQVKASLKSDFVSSPHVTAVFIDLKATSENHLHQLIVNAIYDYRLYSDIQIEALFKQAHQ